MGSDTHDPSRSHRPLLPSARGCDALSEGERAARARDVARVGSRQRYACAAEFENRKNPRVIGIGDLLAVDLEVVIEDAVRGDRAEPEVGAASRERVVDARAGRVLVLSERRVRHDCRLFVPDSAGDVDEASRVPQYVELTAVVVGVEVA